MECGRTGRAVRAVDPCAHLVCDTCLGADFYGCCADCCAWYACPVCDARYETDQGGRAWLEAVPGEGDRDVLRTLGLGTCPDDDVADELSALLARRTPLGAQDHDDLVLLLNSLDPKRLSTLPAGIPVRESKALVLALLAAHDPAALDRYVDSATDVLRLLVVRSGGDPDLLEPVRLRGVPRPLRRQLLSLIDQLDVAAVAEEMTRRAGAFKRVGEVLHPFEHARRHPRAALAFAVLRGTPIADEGALADALLGACVRAGDGIRLVGDRARAVTWAARVENALAHWDIERACDLLRARPGELLRRLDVLLSRAVVDGTPEMVMTALADALPAAGVGPLLGAWGKLAVRPVPGHRRVFFPRGRVTKAYAVDDHRPPLPRRVAERAAELIEAEAVRRLAATGEDRYDAAVLDARLADLPVPYAERASAASLVAVPRGSSLLLPAPGGRKTLRLFLHWMQEKGQRVDLDLSVAFYDDQWRFVGLCDYTRLEWGGRAAVHSGDLTSAPAPHGATEYVDLDLGRLRGSGVRFAMPVVFSYNDVPFDQLPDAFAGFMGIEQGARGRFDARAVRQRFDLAGDAKVLLPMVVDLRTLRAWWADVTLPTGEGNHNVWRHKEALRRLGRDLLDAFQAGDRATLWDIACWTAAARTDGPVVVRGGGTDRIYRRMDGEPRSDFALRVREGWEPDATTHVGRAPGSRVFAALEYADLPDVTTGTLYRLFPGEADAGPLERVTAGDLVARLEPGPR